MIKILQWTSCKIPAHQILTKLEFSWKIFQKYSNVRYH